MTGSGAPVRRRSPWLRAAAWSVAAAAVAAGVWQAEDAGWFDARATAVSDETARAMLCDLTRWDAATAGERRGVAERVAKGLDGFTLLRVRGFGFDDHRHEIAVFRQEATGLEFSLVPGGTFLMGWPPNDPNRGFDEGPQHEVRLTHAFLLARTECTQATYERVTGENPSSFRGPDLPVEQVTWNEAQGFNTKTGLRLPTEAEWEYACRAGTSTQFWSGDAETDLARVGWYRENLDTTPKWVRWALSRLGRSAPAPQTHPVATRAANPFGLHDVHGNVWEWCADWSEDYSAGPVTDPVGPEAGGYRVFRGGSWYDSFATRAASAFRAEGNSEYRSEVLGFRPARSVAP